MNDPASSPLVKVPRCTYRLQFNREFTFRQAVEIAPYLHKLGVSHCYASPYLKARPGSMHGYDIIDHNAINPEIGTEDDHRHYADTLQGLGLGQILDIVPNHMGIMGSDNAWWLDVLEHGPASVYADFFDIDWSPLKRPLQGKVLLPVLGDHYGAVLERGELKLAFKAAQGVFAVHYFEHLLPLDPREYPRILRLGLSELNADAIDEGQHVAELQSLVTALEHLPERTATSPEQIEERQRDTRFLKTRLADLSARWPRFTSLIADTVRAFNGEHDAPGQGLTRFELMHHLLDAQAYRVAYWRVAADEINYRRFFDINDLAALRMEDRRVFEATHAFVMGMVARGELDGLRIDHPDGLHDPVEYFFRLQDAAPVAPGADETAPVRLYVLVEKILAAHEHLPADWPVAGTSGYDFTNLVNGVFIDQDGQKPLDRTYARFIGHTLRFDDLLYACKRRIIRRSLSSELHVLGNRLSRICEADPRTRDYTLSGLRDALQEVVACFPVYRTYITSADLSTQDKQYVDWAVAQAKKRSQTDETSVFDFIRAVLLKELPEDHAATAKAQIAFAMQFQQYTSPVMAKGLEDTAMYNYNRLISLNEVGGDPARFGISVSAFHHHGRERARTWPHAMLATTTHDTK
ncbi:MAG: malto-oligosyltrehalose synthase, partial [Gammaproteobacteria bacterium]|nr:malto-oligosyltrehalose synthase [Gammaproteobacteria bacterium]